MNTVKRRLVAPHTHEGVQLPPGAEINLLPDQAEWLDREQITEPVPPKAPKADHKE